MNTTTLKILKRITKHSSCSNITTLLKYHDDLRKYISSNNSIIVGCNNGDYLIYLIDKDEFCGFTHDSLSNRCVRGIKLLKQYSSFIEGASIWFDFKCDTKQIDVIKHALKIKFKHDFEVRLDESELFIRPIVKSKKDLIKVLTLIYPDQVKYIQSIKSLVSKICIKNSNL